MGSGRAVSNPLLAGYRLLRIAALTLVYLLRHSLALSKVRNQADRRDCTNRYFQGWASGISKIAGIRLLSRGTPPDEGVLLTPNHQSYLDIMAMAALLPVTFVSKAEVASWPVLGLLLRRADQLLVSRNRAKDLVASVEGIADRLRGGHSVCVFLEGTTTGGDGVLKFHPSLLEPVIQGRLRVVPVAIRWGTSNPGITPSEDIAYWKNHNLVLHLWRLLGLNGIEAEVAFGVPISAEGWQRADLAVELRSRVIDLKAELDRADASTRLG